MDVLIDYQGGWGLDGRQRREDPCAHCGMLRTPHGSDGCIGDLPGVLFACCGHGKKPGYLMLCDGTVIRGKFEGRNNIQAEKWDAAMRHTEDGGQP